MRPDPVLVAGLGCTAMADANGLLSVIDAALAEIGAARADLVALASTERRRGHLGLMDAAAALGVPLRLLAEEALTGAAGGLATPSATVLRLSGQLGVAEAAALCAGPLVLPKRKGPGATCALARPGPGFDPYALGRPG